MRIKHLIFLPLAVLMQNIFAQAPVAIDIKQFYAPGSGNYLEVFSAVDPGFFSLKTVKDSGITCNIQELIILRQGEKIIDYRKKNIKSPYFTDSTVAPFTLVERFTALPGKYTLEYVCTDLLKKEATPLKAEFAVNLADRENKTALSQIELVEKISSNIKNKEFSRSGYEIWPYISDFYPDDIEKLAYYTEVYFDKSAVAAQEKFVLMQYLTNFDTYEKVEGFAKMSKVTATDVYPVLNSFDIKNLPTGNYNLVIELKNRNNEIVALEKTYLQRLNLSQALSVKSIDATSISGTFVESMNNTDSLNDFIASVRPIASNPESDMAVEQIKNGNPQSKKQFFYLFWKNRAPLDPNGAWLEYKARVKEVNATFGTRIKRGYETDRGRIYLKYGAPNQITDRPNEPSAYPYQIWQYYKVGRFNNKFFLFYMPDLVGNDYEILNSDVPGEFRNPRWEATLYKRNTQNPNVDFPNQKTGDNFGGNVNDLLKNPR